MQDQLYVCCHVYVRAPIVYYYLFTCVFGYWYVVLLMFNLFFILLNDG